MLEDELLYGASFPMSEEALRDDFVVPIGKAKIERAGEHVTITGTLLLFFRSILLFIPLQVTRCPSSWPSKRRPNWRRSESVRRFVGFFLPSTHFHLQVINLRSLRPLDFATIRESVLKTHHLVTVEQGWPFCGIGAEICTQIVESDAFDFLDSPPLRVTGVDTPAPYQQELEQLVVPKVKNVVAAVKRSLHIE